MQKLCFNDKYFYQLQQGIDALLRVLGRGFKAGRIRVFSPSKAMNYNQLHYPYKTKPIFIIADVTM